MARVSNKKLAALRSRAARAGRAAAGGVKGSALQVLSGALSAYGIQKLAENSSFVRSQWWLPPAVLAGVGYALKRKAKFAPVGNAMLGAAGYSLAQLYALNQSNRPAETGAMYAVRGQLDTGALYSPGLPSLSPGAATSPSAGTSRYDASVAASL